MKTPDATSSLKPREQATPLPGKIEELKFFHGAFSQVGTAHQELNLPNQDAFLSIPEQGIFGVFDGVGGRQAGEVASAASRDFMQERAPEMFPWGTPEEEKKQVAENLFLETHRLLLAEGQKDLERHGMATTASLALFENAGPETWALLAAQVGDSRISILRADGALDQLTIDDTYAAIEFLKKEGWDEEKLRDLQARAGRDELTREELNTFLRLGNILNSGLGGRSNFDGKPKFYSATLHKGDIVILGSDGLFHGLTERELIEIIRASSDNLEQAAKLLVLRARISERTKDDLTVVLTRPCSSEK